MAKEEVVDLLVDQKTTLVTGAAGFIGFHLAYSMLESGYPVVGFDNIDAYYDVRLKRDRLSVLAESPLFTFVEGDISSMDDVSAVFGEFEPSRVVNLAAQAGVRYSLENPAAYVQSNVVGFANILEACRHHPVEHLMYASSSSVYGGNLKVPFSEIDPVEHPVSLYAATKRSNELMADTYAHLFGVRSTGLRFFTVYGELGRPDMAYFSFTRNYFEGRPIRLFNNGVTSNDLSRDFTYIGDVVESLRRLLSSPPSGTRPHRILNVGGSNPVSLTRFVALLEGALSNAVGRAVVFDKIFEGAKPGDVHSTFADNSSLREIIGYVPETSLEDGLGAFAEWYVSRYVQ